METQNITLALPKKLLRRVKLLAARRETSISRMLTEVLEELVERDDDYERARRRALTALAHPAAMRTSGRATWTRENLHTR